MARYRATLDTPREREDLFTYLDAAWLDDERVHGEATSMEAGSPPS
jgi:hypothetical protein